MQYMRSAQNVSGDHKCGWCSLGCRYSEKQSTVVTFLKKAAGIFIYFFFNRSIRIILTPYLPIFLPIFLPLSPVNIESGNVDFLVETTAVKVHHKHRKVTGVEVKDKNGEKYIVPTKVFFFFF